MNNTDMNSSKKKKSTLVENKSISKDNNLYISALEEYIEKSYDSNLEKVRNFTKYVPRQNLTDFLAKYEIFKKIINVQGSIIECGVFKGYGLMTWANLSSIFEPYNHQRKIIGFDTFNGIPNLSEEDKTSISENCYEGALNSNAYDDLTKCINIYDMNRALPHINKVFLHRGDITETVPKFIEENPHIVVSLLYLDAVVYEPTKTALQHIVPRMPKGSIIVFDELNAELWPGETIAVDKELGISNLEIKRLPFASFLSYAIL